MSDDEHTGWRITGVSDEAIARAERAAAAEGKTVGVWLAELIRRATGTSGDGASGPATGGPRARSDDPGDP